MRRIIYLFSIVAAMCFACGCEKEGGSKSQQETGQFTVYATILNESGIESKIAHSEDAQFGLKQTWNSDKSDKIIGCWKESGNDELHNVSFKVNALLKNNSIAELVTEDYIPAYKSVELYLLCVPSSTVISNIGNISFSKGIPVDFTAQDGSLDGLNNYAYLYAAGTSDKGVLNVSFHNIYSVLRFAQFDGLEETTTVFTLSSPDLSAKGTIQFTDGKLDFVADDDASNTITVTSSSALRTVSDSSPLYVAFPVTQSGMNNTSFNVKSNDIDVEIAHERNIEQGKCYKKDYVSFYERFRWIMKNDGSFFSYNGNTLAFAGGNLYYDNGWAFESKQYKWRRTYSGDVETDLASGEIPFGGKANSGFRYVTLQHTILKDSTDWKVLSTSGWTGLFNVTAGNNYSIATVKIEDVSVQGMILIPDGFVDPKCNLNENKDKVSDEYSKNHSVTEHLFVAKKDVHYLNDYSTNLYNAAGWTAMEEAGAIFFPYIGYLNSQNGNRTWDLTDWHFGYYLASNSGGVYYVLLKDDGISTSNGSDGSVGLRLPVRLVKYPPAS